MKNFNSPLLKYFAAFFSFVKEHKVTLTSKYDFISRNFCFDLNGKLAVQATDITPTSPQTRYPMIQLMFQLALVGRLLIKRPAVKNKHQLILVPTERLAIYEDLTPVEQYFFLLEMLWVEARWSYLQPKGFFPEPSEIIPDILEFLDNSSPEEAVNLKRAGQYTRIGELFRMLNYFVLYFAYFGFWSVELETRSETYEYKHQINPKAVTPTLFGNKLAFILRRERHLWFWNKRNRQESHEKEPIPGSYLPKKSAHINLPQILGLKIPEHLSLYTGRPEPFLKAFVPLFPRGSLQKTLPQVTASYQKGIYTFKVSLGKTWRIIELSSHHTLDDLHEIIQEAYQFDRDHLYSFFMDNRRWSRNEEFTSPNADQGIHADEVEIGRLDLFVGKQFLYLFDYGDEWLFNIIVRDISITDELPPEPHIRESHGKSPEQYR